MKKYIYALCFESQIPTFYIDLSKKLEKWGVNLVPITLKEFDLLVGRESAHLVVATTSLEAKRHFNKIRFHKFERLVKINQLHLYEISSFPSQRIIKGTLVCKNHTLISLPESYERIGAMIIKDYLLSSLSKGEIRAISA